MGDTDEVKGIPEIDDEEISQDESYAPRLWRQQTQNGAFQMALEKT